MPLKYVTAGILQVAGALVANVFCCCCRIVNNAFGSDNLATDFTVVSGTWAITGGVLRASSGAAVVLNVATLTDGTGQESGTFLINTDGLKAIIYGAYNDSSNHIFAEIERTGATSSTAKLWKRVSGTNTQLGPTIPVFGDVASARTFSLCWDGSYAYFHDGSNTNRLILAACTLTGTSSGLGAEASGGQVDFDSLQVKNNHTNSTGCSSCTPCWLTDESLACLNGTQGTQVQVDLTGMANGACSDCTNMNTTYICDLNLACRYQLLHTASSVTVCSGAKAIGATHQRSTASALEFVQFGNPSLFPVDFRNASATPRNCTGNITLPHFSNGDVGCDGTSATCVASWLA